MRVVLATLYSKYPATIFSTFLLGTLAFLIYTLFQLTLSYTLPNTSRNIVDTSKEACIKCAKFDDTISVTLGHNAFMKEYSTLFIFRLIFQFQNIDIFLQLYVYRAAGTRTIAAMLPWYYDSILLWLTITDDSLY